VAAVSELIAAGHRVNRFDELGKTPLHYAAEGEHFETVELLIAHGADVNARHEPSLGNTPLREVADRCSLRMAKLLIAAGADPIVPGWMQITALDKAASRKRAEGPAVYDLLVRSARNPGTPAAGSDAGQTRHGRGARRPKRKRRARR